MAKAQLKPIKKWTLIVVHLDYVQQQSKYTSNISKNPYVLYFDGVQTVARESFAALPELNCGSINK